MKKILLLTICLVLTTSWAQAESDHYDELANLPFPGNQPTQETADILHDELIFQRGVQSYLWAMPAMNMYGMREGQRKAFGDDSNVLIITKDRPDYNMLFSTANPDVIYAFAWLDLKKEGPMVLDMPPKLQGLLDDMWHRPITDIGAAGPDRNKGGKYLILPPNFEGKVPEGYFTKKSPTNGVFIFLRAFLVDGKTDQGVALLEKSRIYPLSKSDNPPKMKFPNASGVPMDGDFPRGFEYFERLADFIDYETVSREDFAMRGIIAGLGIVKGQPFKPDAKTKALLEKAGQVGFKMAATLSYDFRPKPKIYDNRSWEQMFIGGSPVFEKDTYHNQNASVSFFHKAYSTSKAMVLAMPGKGSQYLLGSRDSDGELLTGKNTYRIHMPANVPVLNYWSIVLYDADTRVLMDNGQPFPSVASNQKVSYNSDGSADVYLGPNQPEDKDANWIKTVPGRGYFAGIRLYSPTEAFFEQTWVPDDIVKINSGIPVTSENYVQAETDWNFVAQQANAKINTWTHKGVVTKDSQTIIRSNADVVYSLALVDVSEGVTFSIPKRENGKLQLIHYIDENHLTNGVVYAGESVTITPKDLTGGNYVYILARTQVSDSLEETKTAQHSMVIDAKSAKPYIGKGYDENEVEAYRIKLINNVTSGKVKPEAAKAYGAKLADLEYSDYMHGAALGWGALPPQHAQYTPSVKGQGSDEKCQTITIPKPNLDYKNGGFFSLTTYNNKSWIDEEQFHIGHERMKDNGNGTMSIDFNCDTPYSVTVGKNWNGTFRLYKPVNVQETIGTIKELVSIGITKK